MWRRPKSGWFTDLVQVAWNLKDTKVQNLVSLQCHCEGQIQSHTSVCRKTFLCCDRHRTDPRGIDVFSKGQHLQGAQTGRKWGVPHQEWRHGVEQGRLGFAISFSSAWTRACTHSTGSFTGMGKGGRKLTWVMDLWTAGVYTHVLEPCEC